jgi:hypothetical protein
LYWNRPSVGNWTVSTNDHYRKDRKYIIGASARLWDICELFVTITESAESRPNSRGIRAPSPSDLWKAELARANKSILGRIVNETSVPMKKIAHKVIAGKWRKEPSELIKPCTLLLRSLK